MSNSTLRRDSLTGRVALVTGAAQGLGLAIATTLARRGAMVTLADVQGTKAAAAAEELRRQGLTVDGVELNIADSSAVTACFQKVAAAHGSLDIVVNNAGVGQNVAPIVELTDAEWQRVLGITLTGTFYCCRAAAGIMEGQG